MNDELIRAIVDAFSQHATWLHRASTAQVNQVRSQIDRLAAELGKELGVRLDNLSPGELQAFASGRYTTDKLKALRAEIDAWARSINEAVTAGWREGATQLAGYESTFAARLAGNPKTTVPAAAVYRAVMRQPVLGVLVDSMLAKVADDTKDRVYSRIRLGISQGETSRDIVRALVGTPPMRHKDGLLEVSRRQAEAVIRTARNHVSNVSYNETYKLLGVEEVADCATLDGRTTKFCASIDGRRHKVGTQHPKPPYHVNCRTVQIPVFDDMNGMRPYVRAFRVRGRDGKWTYRPIRKMTKRQREAAGLKVGQVRASTTYKEWFADQSADYQREWLGPSRYKLYKEGRYSIDRFVDPTGREYSLAELRQRDAATFREIFGD